MEPERKVCTSEYLCIREVIYPILSYRATFGLWFHKQILLNRMWAKKMNKFRFSSFLPRQNLIFSWTSFHSLEYTLKSAKQHYRKLLVSIESLLFFLSWNFRLSAHKIIQLHSFTALNICWQFLLFIENILWRNGTETVLLIFYVTRDWI